MMPTHASRRIKWLGCAVALAAAAACGPKAPPATGPAAAWRVPAVPAELAASPARPRYDDAWARVRRGDLGGGERAFEDIARRFPDFYPALAALGEIRLRRQQYAAAAVVFDRVVATHATYLPALVGAVDAKLGAGDDAAALQALEQLLAVDPASPGAAGRLDVVRLRVAQDEMLLATRAYDDGHFEEAGRHVARALEATPENGAALRLASSIELGLGHPDLAESRARRAAEIDPQDPKAHAALGEALEASGRHAEALQAYDRAVALDPSADMRARRDALAKASAASGLPAPYRAIETAGAVSRADVAAVLGVRLAGTLAASPERSSEVVTDVRGHWAERWILSVVRARWMDPLPNHTFQPSSTMRRSDLAAVVARVLGDAAAGRPRDLARWRDARPVFADVTRDHAAYRVAALAVSAGVMTAEGGRFAPARAVSGPELMAVMERLQRVLGR